MAETTHDEQEELHVWPAFVDLLAASSLLFVTLVAVFIFIAYQRQVAVTRAAAGLLTERDSLVAVLHRTTAADRGVYAVEHDGQFVRLRIQEEATFPQGQFLWTTLRDTGRGALEEIGAVLRDPAISSLYREVRVIGHSDSVAYAVDNFSNWELSASRAAVVARYLVNHVGVDPCKISASGVGPYYPVERLATELSVENRNQQNRRIEIEIIPARAAGEGTRPGCQPFGDGSAAGAQGR
jgi:flagellar motor protein MotB